MAEYIDRIDFINKLEVINGCVDCNEKCRDCGVNDIKGMLRSIPAADVAPAVKCKECKYYESAKVNNKGFLICPASGMEITDNDFCSYGERKENNNTLVSKIPAADVERIVHGHWIVYTDWGRIIGNIWKECSVCHARIEGKPNSSKSYSNNFCTNCGAKMDE